jgi:hypothetical protein
MVGPAADKHRWAPETAADVTAAYRGSYNVLLSSILLLYKVKSPPMISPPYRGGGV